MKQQLKKNKNTYSLDNKIKYYVYHWMQLHKPYIKKSTYAIYLTNIENHILPYFGYMDLSDITIEVNQKFILFLFQKERLNGNGKLSIKMVKNIMSIWLSILNLAKEENIIDLQEYHYKYPDKNILYPTKEKAKCLSIEQEIKIINFLQNNLNIKNIGILISLLTGMRIGEICALRWENINLKNKEIYVTETLQRIYLKNTNKSAAKGSSEILISKPKSQKSIRTIPLTDYLVKILLQFQKDGKCFFLTGSTDKYMEPRTYRDYYTRLLKKQNLLFVTFHGLRHTFATRCIESGSDYKTVSELLGHADVETTLRLYVHSDMEQKRKCIDNMHNLCLF